MSVKDCVAGACLLVTLANPAGGQERSSLVSLASGLIDVSSAAAEFSRGLEVAAAEAGSEDYALVKFSQPPGREQLLALEDAVERVYTYLPFDSFLVRMPLSRQPELLAPEIGASWVGPYHPLYKISPGVRALRSGGEERRFPVLLHVYPDAPLAELVRATELLAHGEVAGTRDSGRFSRIRLLLTAEELATVRDDLARLKHVFWIELEGRRVLLNDTTRWVAQSGTDGGQRTPVHDHGILGQRQIIGVIDTGIDVDMCYFRDPLRGTPPINLCNGGTETEPNQRKVIAVDFLWPEECNGGIGPDEWDTSDHGSHVAGIAAGDDFSRPLTHDPGDGLAPGAKLVVQDCGALTDDCADCPGLGCPVVDLEPIFRQAYQQGARIHTNSWGDEENNPVRGLYSAGSEDSDEFMWQHPDSLLVYATGNAGPGEQTVISPATGKNVLAVGNTLRASEAEAMATSSSCGPTTDGRIKPDVTMPGTGILSADSDNDSGSFNCSTRSATGTSMAAPAAAGAAALVRQYFMDGWYPTGSRVAGNGFVPSAALLKATLIHSGHDMTGEAAIPSSCQGWGRVLLDDALYFRPDRRKLFVEDERDGFARGSSGEDRTFELFVGPDEPFKVTLTWTDFPATPAANPTIVNDLDLIVSGPTGTYLGNVFAGGQSTTGGSFDRLNTVEQVLVRQPRAGLYLVTVRSSAVPRGPQPFALVASGDLGSCHGDADCDDGLFCTGVESCVDGSCRAGADPCPGQLCDEAGERCVQCVADGDCDDGVSCTVDSCEMATGSCQSTSDDALCDDGFLCDGLERCDALSDCQPGTPVACDGDETDLTVCITDDRFCVESRWTDFTGRQGRGRGVELTGNATSFWFFDPANIEMLVKVHDACVEPFEHFWVFAAGLTNVEVELGVTDTESGQLRRYGNPLGQAFLPIQDTSAFATCDAGPDPSSGGAVAPESTLEELESLLAELLPEPSLVAPASPSQAVEGSCEPGEDRLCLAGGRFQVETEWEIPSGQAGPGRAAELSDDSGYFWFFAPDNVEVLVKVIDACVEPFDRFWFFAAGLTNLEVRVRVTDTATGETREYQQAQGTAFQPIQDTDAFATCP